MSLLGNKALLEETADACPTTVFNGCQNSQNECLKMLSAEIVIKMSDSSFS